MPLDSALVALPLPGLKQSADARVAPVEGAAQLRNYVIKRATALCRRNGFAGPAFAGGAIPLRSTPLPGGGHHVLLTDGRCVTTADQGATVSRPGVNAISQQELGLAPFAAPQVLAREAFLTQGATFERAQVHAARTQNFLVLCACVTADAGSSEIVLSIYDADGTLLVAAQRTGLLASTTGHFVLLAEQTGDNVMLVTPLGGTALVGRRFAISAAGASLAASATLVTLGGAGFLWDAALGAAGSFWITFDNNAAPGISARSFSTTTMAPLTASTALLATVRPSALSIAVAGFPMRMAIASVDQGTNAQRGTLVDLTGAGVTVASITSGATPALSRAVAACVVNPGAAAGALCAVYLWSAEQDNAIVTPITGVLSTRAQAQNGAGGALGAGVAWVGVRPAAKPFVGPSGCVAFFDVLAQRAAGSQAAVAPNPNQPEEPGFATVACAILSTLESGAPALAASPEPLAWHNLSRASAAGAPGRLAASIPLSDGSVLTCLTALDRASLRTQFSFTIPHTSANALTVRGLALRYRFATSFLTAADAPTRPYAVAGATALIAGAAPCLAQGRGVTPAGYVHPPEIMGARQTVTGTSSVWLDTYISIRARYVWYDGRGNELTSAWSLPSQIATPTAVANTRIDVYLRNPFAWPGDATSERHPMVEVAVAKGTSTSFSRALLIDLSAPTGNPFNLLPTNVGAVVRVGLTADNLTSELVTTSDLANDPPPCASFLAVGQSRHLLVSPEDDAVYFSKPALTGVLPEWSLALTLAPSGGTGRPVAAIEVGDRKVIVGNAGACFYLGDGPDGGGNGAFFSGPYEAATGHGCISASSVCQAPGVAFWRTRHSIVAFSGGAGAASSVDVIGRDVQNELDAYPFTLASCYDPGLNAAIWLVSDVFDNRALLLFDLTHKAWLAWDTPGLGGATDLAADNTGLYLTGGSKVARYDLEGTGDGYDANSATFPVGKVRSQAARLADINGFQRAWVVAVKYESFQASNTLTLRCYRDGKATSDPPRTSGPLGLGVNIVRFHLPANLQRCSTLEVELTDDQPEGPDIAPAGVSILGVTLRIAGKKGIRGLPASQKA